MSTMNYFRYTNNAATDFAIKEEVDIAAATGTGFGTASAADPSPPFGFVPRVVYVKNTASGRRRSVRIATAAAYATLMAGGGSLTLPEKGSGTALVWNVTNGRDEHQKRGTIPHLIH
jgi:hypothetical protein